MNNELRITSSRHARKHLVIPVVNKPSLKNPGEPRPGENGPKTYRDTIKTRQGKTAQQDKPSPGKRTTKQKEKKTGPQTHKGERGPKILIKFVYPVAESGTCLPGLRTNSTYTITSPRS